MIQSGNIFNNKAVKAVIINLSVAAFLGTYYLVLNLIGISCPIKAVLGIKCPTCGVTTALLCLLKGDLRGYWSTQPFALLLASAVLLEINGFLFKKRIAIDIYAVTVAAANFVYYLVVNFF